MLRAAAGVALLAALLFAEPLLHALLWLVRFIGAAFELLYAVPGWALLAAVLLLLAPVTISKSKP